MAPELATQARDFLVESVAVLGKSPNVEIGEPIRVRVVAEVEEILKRDRVLEPAFTATSICQRVSVGCRRVWKVYISVSFDSALAEKCIWACGSILRPINTASALTSSQGSGSLGQSPVCIDFEGNDGILGIIGDEVNSFGGFGSRCACSVFVMITRSRVS